MALAKHFNLIYFLLVSLLFVVLLQTGTVRFSTNLLESLIPSGNETLEKAKALGISNELFIAVKGFDEEALHAVDSMAHALEKNAYVLSLKTSLTPDAAMQEYIKTRYYLLADINRSRASHIERQLKNLYDSLVSSVYYKPINTTDPLGLFSFPFSQEFPAYKQHLILPRYGYLLIAKTSVSPDQLGHAETLYTQVQALTSKFPDTLSFAPFYFSVENSRAIKSDVTFIVVLSSLLLLAVYVVMLRNIALLFHTLIALASSIITSLIIGSFFFSSINALALAFVISISTVSIDYMFHHYFLLHYVHKQRPSKSVFFGFLTTFSAFLILSFIDNILLSQIALLSALSLLCAYMLFSFAFVFIGFKAPLPGRMGEEEPEKKGTFFLAASVILAALAAANFDFDTEIKHIDYDNKTLKETQQRFSEALNNHSTQLALLSAPTLDALLQKAASLKHAKTVASLALDQQRCQERLEALQSSYFLTLSKKVQHAAGKSGFKAGTFSHAYDFSHLTCKTVDYATLQALSPYPLIKDMNGYTTLVMLESPEIPNGVTSLDFAKILSEHTRTLLHELYYYLGAIGIIVVILLLTAVGKKHFVYALSFILFPSSVSLFLITLLGKVNIMHIYSLIIVTALCIDYGIYMSNAKKMTATTKAIEFSLLSTFAGFGVLIFSSINALFSIGIVISSAIAAIFLMLKTHAGKRS